MDKEIKSALRYPGGKSKSIKQILPLIPRTYKEFREPFVGGGSVFIAAMQQLNPNALYKINDLNYDLYCFWKYLKESGKELVEELWKIKRKYNDGKILFNYLVDSTNNWTDFQRAVRFFVLNRITFSGTIESGGYSDESYRLRFTDSSIERLTPLSNLIKNVVIEYGDYENQVLSPGENVFIFLDPPYLSRTKSRLYGKNGDLHLQFDHKKFALNMKKSPHKWLITYDDSPEVRELFDFAYITEWKVQYGMNNYKQKSAKKGDELFISNYLDSSVQSKLI
jgi:DNA adenine methylase